MRPFAYLLAVLVLGVAGFGAGLLLIPRESELGLIYLKSGRYAEAVPIFERELERGRLTPDTVASLATLYVHYARHDEAIALYERYLVEHPGDPAAATALAELYLETYRLHDYTVLMATVGERSPAPQDPATLRTLIAIEWRHGRYDAWKEALGRLVASGQADGPETIGYAEALAAAGEGTRAIPLLEARLEGDAVRSLDPETAQRAAMALVALLLDEGREDEATAAAERFVRSGRPVRDLLRLVWLFQSRAAPEAAIAVIGASGHDPAADGELLRQSVWLDIGTGRAVRALERLAAMDRTGSLGRDDMDLLVQAALQTGRLDIAAEAVGKASPDRLGAPLIGSFVRAALAADRADDVDALLRRAGPDFLDANPLIAARIALARDDRDGLRRWVARARKRGVATVAERIELAVLSYEAGERDAAADTARELLALTTLDGDALVAMAAIAVELDLAADLRALIGRSAAAAAGSPWPMAARLFLEPRSGIEKALEVFEAETGTAAERLQLLNIMLQAALSVDRFDLAEPVAHRLVTADPSEQNRLLLGAVFARSGNWEQALRTLEPHVGTGDMVDWAYQAALLAGLRADGKRPENLERRAVRFMERRLGDDRLPTATRRSMAYDLVELDRLDLVLPSLARLAATVEGRADPAVFDLYVEALLRAGRREVAARMLARAVPETPVGDRLRVLARLAYDASAYPVATAAYERLLAADPKDPEAVRALGFLAYYRYDLAPARERLSRYVTMKPGDWEAAYRLGEIIVRFPDWENARPHFRAALDEIDRLPDPDVAALTVRAHILYRLARFDESVAMHRTLIERFPDNVTLRQQLSDVLAAMGRYEEAIEVLRGP